MGTPTDAVARIKSRLTKIALRDTKDVLEQNAAFRRAAELGLTSEQVLKLVTDDFLVPISVEGQAEQEFYGFKNRHQAMLAAYAGMAKQHRPAALGDAAERVNTLIKNQAPERAATTIGLAVISIPAMATEAIPDSKVKHFRRLASGKLRELGPAGIIDVDAGDAPESTIVIKERRRLP